MCRGDLKPYNCHNCIRKATKKFTESCNNHTTSIVWSDECLLRYSNRSLFGTMEFEPCVMLMNVNNATKVTHFNQVLTTLLDGLITQAASGDSLLKFALGNATVSNSETIYALAQCTPDLSQEDCNNCLSNATDLLSQGCSGRLAARVFTPSCNIRYGKQIFYDPLVAMPLPPPPPPVADAPILPPVDEPSPSPSPPVVSSAPPPQKPCIEIGEGNMNSGFQVLATVVPVMILQYFVL